MASLARPNDDRPGRLFVGRERELTWLRAGLEEAIAGRGSCFLVVGESGIGKTRLVEELAREAAQCSGVALWGRCWEGAGAPPYWPWVQVIRACVRAIGDERIHRLVGTGASSLVHLVPELRELLPDAAAPSFPPQSDHARFYLFDAVTTFFKAAAAATPLVLALDDLQWADAPSLLLMRFLARELHDARLLLIGTYREAEVREAAAAEALGALARDGRHVRLRGFDEEEVRLFIEGTTGRTVSPALVRAVHSETEGNPFFVDEIVRLLVTEPALEQHGDTSPARFPVPQGVREAIRRRLARLPSRCKDVLAVASVIGRDFDLACLQRASGLSGEALLRTLHPALAGEIVVREPNRMGRYRFGHALIRETIYGGIAPAECAKFHGRIGEVLEDLHGAEPSSELAALAHHFLEAAVTGTADKAVAYSIRAGRHAATSLAYEAADAHFASALDALEQARPADDHARCELLLARGEVQWKSGDGRGARDAFREGAEIARRLRDPVLFARSALGFAGEGSRLLWTRSGVVDHARVELLEEALSGLGNGEPALRARLLARLAITLYWAPEPDRVLALSEEAVAIARQLGDPWDLAAVLRARWVALWRPETTDERLAIADEVVALGDRTGDRELGLLGRRFRIVGFLERGAVAAVDREIEASARIADDLRQPLYRIDVAMWRATRAIMDGRFAEGQAHASRMLELGEREPDAEAIMRYQVQGVVLHFHQGGLDRFEPPPVPSDTTAPALVRCHRALLLCETGHEAEARRELGALAQDGFDVPRDGAWLVYMAVLAAVASELNDRTSAASLYELLLPYGDRVAITGAGLTCWGSVSHYLGLLASTLGRVAEASRHFADATTLHDHMGARPFRAWTEFAHARLLLRADAATRRAEATALLASALASARELGMDGLTAKVRRLGLESEPEGAAVFRHEGDFWTLAYAGKAVRLRHGKGLADIATLLANPGKEIHVANLIASASRPPETRNVDSAALLAEGLRVSRGDSADPVLDARARADYRERLADLHRELEGAERCNDEGRAARARAELDFIAGELASALGLGGRGRHAGSPVERARKAVASRIRFSLTHIARLHPELGSHLRRYIRTGTFCTYVVPDQPVQWSV